jgi:hypothetical protein
MGRRSRQGSATVGPDARLEVLVRGATAAGLSPETYHDGYRVRCPLCAERGRHDRRCTFGLSAAGVVLVSCFSCTPPGCPADVRREFHGLFCAALSLEPADVGLNGSGRWAPRVAAWVALVHEHEWGRRRRTVLRLAQTCATLAMQAGGPFQLSVRLAAVYIGRQRDTAWHAFHALTDAGFLVRRQRGYSGLDRATGELSRKGTTWDLGRIDEPVTIPGRSPGVRRIVIPCAESGRPGEALDLSLRGAMFETLGAMAAATPTGLTVNEWAAAGGVVATTLTRRDGHIERLLRWGLIVELNGARSLDVRRYAAVPDAIRERAASYAFVQKARENRARAEWQADDMAHARAAGVSAARITGPEDDATADTAWAAVNVRDFVVGANEPASGPAASGAPNPPPDNRRYCPAGHASVGEKCWNCGQPTAERSPTATVPVQTMTIRRTPGLRPGIVTVAQHVGRRRAGGTRAHA